MQFKTLYGPVRSGRLGLSLGVDLLGKRICSLDCVYCEVGPTRVHTLERRVYMPARTILEELHSWKRQGLPKPEVITLGGLGEPCLNTELEEIIVGSRAIFPDIPVAVLTNSTLLHDPSVRRELATTQMVLPSLDTLVPEEFVRINTPCSGVSLENITSGLLELRSRYSGRIFLEILLARGINDTPKNLTLLRDFLPKLGPDRVDVVTMTRPGASPLAEAVDQRTLTAWRVELQGTTDPKQDIEQPAAIQAQDQIQGVAQDLTTDAQRELVLNSLRRRPQTIDQVREALGLGTEQTRAVFADLTAQGAIQHAQELGEDFFQAAP
ncbi:radical SAM protein [Desulfonatronum sp. SC1]|uniref:radical SAM protein n=1 Tax=Desulfonatronum sp. SC1 TaxID=2109626 RepID=UPI000D2FFE19|nr:radical SAM protein [Desulfonatronum sp. SC1]PTN36902.1 radical SAM protein [Desulfonatronum sp. SC1]